jgi:hypothetical protein
LAYGYISINNYNIVSDMKEYECDGWKSSDCCGTYTNTDILICSACGEHCSTMCEECEEKEDCELRSE